MASIQYHITSTECSSEVQALMQEGVTGNIYLLGEEHPEGSAEWTAEKNRLKSEFETAFLDAQS